MDGLGNPKAYDREAHARFTVLMERWGDATCVAESRRARHAMRAGVAACDYPAPGDKRARHALRIAIRELAQQAGDTPIIAEWRRRFDRARSPRHPHLVH